MHGNITEHISSYLETEIRTHNHKCTLILHSFIHTFSLKWLPFINHTFGEVVDTCGSHHAWSRTGSRTYTLLHGWRNGRNQTGGPWSRSPWWCSASPQTCTCRVDSPPRSGPRDSSAGRRHRPCRCRAQCSCPGTGGGSTRPSPYTPAGRTTSDKLEGTHRKTNTDVKPFLGLFQENNDYKTTTSPIIFTNVKQLL